MVRVVGILLQKLSDEQDPELKVRVPTVTQASESASTWC